ncbi:MAG: Nramp family divalent metal transporter [Phycisphaerales bacterium]|nr:MAG: Nramp family divalent metal transporter [Phycisphaerales bacterium]
MLAGQKFTRSGLLKTLGPGVMYAGAAIGVSHLVQATRAGAGYGFELVWAVILVHLFKYPFFEFGHRYTAATGESLLVGYRRVGRWALVGYLVVALGLSVPTAAVLTIVTAGMAAQILPLELTPMGWGLLLLAGCIVGLASGGYRLLDKVMKLLMAFLAVCTAVALVAAVSQGRVGSTEFEAPGVWEGGGIVFLVALMGWMPTPVDASSWPSLWMQERMKQTGHQPTLHEALFDFHLGYVGSLITALMFLSLGALVMFGTGETIAGRADDFAAQFVSMYTGALGRWSRPVVVVAVFITMLSTTLTVLDGYPRVLTAGCRLAWPGTVGFQKVAYWVFLLIMIVGALLIFQYLTSHMRTLVDFAASVAFLSAPLFAYLNYRVIAGGSLPREAIPPRWLLVLSWAGLVFLAGFSILYLEVRFGWLEELIGRL